MRSRIHCGHIPLSNLPTTKWRVRAIRICGQWIKRSEMHRDKWEKLLRIVRPFVFIHEAGKSAHCYIFGVDGLKESRLIFGEMTHKRNTW